MSYTQNDFDIDNYFFLIPFLMEKIKFVRFSLISYSYIVVLKKKCKYVIKVEYHMILNTDFMSVCKTKRERHRFS